MDDQNNNSGTTPEPTQPTPMGGGSDQPAVPAEEKCTTCGNAASGGNCVPCGQNQTGCTCTPAGSAPAGGEMGQGGTAPAM